MALASLPRRLLKPRLGVYTPRSLVAAADEMLLYVDPEGTGALGGQSRLLKPLKELGGARGAVLLRLRL
jgi:hypothetical protein